MGGLISRWSRHGSLQERCWPRSPWWKSCYFFGVAATDAKLLTERRDRLHVRPCRMLLPPILPAAAPYPMSLLWAIRLFPLIDLLFLWFLLTPSNSVPFGCTFFISWLFLWFGVILFTATSPHDRQRLLLITYNVRHPFSLKLLWNCHELSLKPPRTCSVSTLRLH